jgi:mannose-6-phosphate isomerase-like protein (cupin superfamily)
MDWFWVLVFIITLIIVSVAWLITRNVFSASPRADASIWSANIESVVGANNDWRRVLATADGLQVVAMSVERENDSLGWEVHNEHDQFFQVEKGNSLLKTALSDGGSAVSEVTLTDGSAALVPRGLYHNLVNKGPGPLKFYTIYGPKHHPPGTVDRTHADEIARE